jgi:hypothetical protein
VDEPGPHDEAFQRGETGEFQRVDLTTRDRVTAIQAKWESALRRMWFAIIGLTICAFIGGYFLWRNNQDIQSSREQATFETCQESNDRHDRTVIAFNHEIALRLANTSDPDERKRLEQSRAANIRLINVFIPVHKDSAGRSTCREFARGRVNVDG